MKKKDEIILEIADVNFPNKAYGYYEGEKVIVKNAVPGQKVQAQVFKKRGSGVEARLQEVIERSPMERETGMCSHYALCGGCTYQTMRHEEELQTQGATGKTAVGKRRDLCAKLGRHCACAFRDGLSQ